MRRDDDDPADVELTDTQRAMLHRIAAAGERGVPIARLMAEAPYYTGTPRPSPEVQAGIVERAQAKRDRRNSRRLGQTP